MKSSLMLLPFVLFSLLACSNDDTNEKNNRGKMDQKERQRLHAEEKSESQLHQTIAAESRAKQLEQLSKNANDNVRALQMEVSRLTEERRRRQEGLEAANQKAGFELLRKTDEIELLSEEITRLRLSNGNDMGALANAQSELEKAKSELARLKLKTQILEVALAKKNERSKLDSDDSTIPADEVTPNETYELTVDGEACESSDTIDAKAVTNQNRSCEDFKEITQAIGDNDR